MDFGDFGDWPCSKEDEYLVTLVKSVGRTFFVAAQILPAWSDRRKATVFLGPKRMILWTISCCGCLLNTARIACSALEKGTLVRGFVSGRAQTYFEVSSVGKLQEITE